MARHAKQFYAPWLFGDVSWFTVGDRRHRRALRTIPAIRAGSGHRIARDWISVHETWGCAAVWCGREDSNFHGLPHSDLNAARLPIPPRPHVAWRQGRRPAAM